MLGRHVLVVEGDDGGAVGQRPQVGEVAVVADPDVGGDERRRLGRVGGQHPQRLPQRDRGLVRHPGQLPAADHRHDGRAGARIEWGSHGGARLSGAPDGAAVSSTVGQVAWAQTVAVRMGTTMGTTWRLLLKELSAFGVVGAVCFGIDIVLFQVLYVHAGLGAVTAKFLATLVSMTVAYFAHRYWSFSHRARTGVRREYTIFGAGQRGHPAAQPGRGVRSCATRWASTAPSSCSSPTSSSIAVGTVIRYLSYRKWVFPALPSAVSCGGGSGGAVRLTAVPPSTGEPGSVPPCEHLDPGGDPGAQFLEVADHADRAAAPAQLVEDAHHGVERAGVEGAEPLVDEQGVDLHAA